MNFELLMTGDGMIDDVLAWSNDGFCENTEKIKRKGNVGKCSNDSRHEWRAAKLKISLCHLAIPLCWTKCFADKPRFVVDHKATMIKYYYFANTLCFKLHLKIHAIT